MTYFYFLMKNLFENLENLAKGKVKINKLKIIKYKNKLAVKVHYIFKHYFYCVYFRRGGENIFFRGFNTFRYQFIFCFVVRF